MTVTKMFGESAWKVWRFLEEKKKCPERKLKKKVKLKDDEFYGAIMKFWVWFGVHVLKLSI